RRAAAYAVGVVLSGASSLRDAAPRILEAVCTHLGWHVGALWTLDPERQMLRSFAVWTAEAGVAPFVTRTREVEFPQGSGLPGRVWSSGRPHWIEDVGVDTNFPRAPAAVASGLHGGFGFPIRLGAEVLGVVEFFHRTVLAPDPETLETMESVGQQIGQFIARQHAERAMQQAERERQDLLERERAARREAETANRAKDEFLATLSHELRTPLNAIAGWTRMLLDGAVEPSQVRRTLEVIDRNAQAQAQLVADLLDVSRIIAGGLTIDQTPVDLVAVVGGALDAIRPAAQAKQISVAARLPDSPLVAMGDAARLRQIVANLLVNAVKFTPEGGRVEVALSDDAGPITLQVRDNGIGIDRTFLPHVFERFRQGDASTARRHGGLGLGLAIVQHLVELHGGTVTAESDGSGTGAAFTVTMPYRTPSPARRPA
ncbi:MAG TPA: GAF domain-containing sensor histidine kinase, partial [Vicinamibacterales bacterium]|nr:GAF domain-containing sensor histidine kinase [Vicinamibacterales bacterium]